MTTSNTVQALQCSQWRPVRRISSTLLSINSSSSQLPTTKWQLALTAQFRGLPKSELQGKSPLEIDENLFFTVGLGLINCSRPSFGVKDLITLSSLPAWTHIFCSAHKEFHTASHVPKYPWCLHYRLPSGATSAIRLHWQCEPRVVDTCSWLNCTYWSSDIACKSFYRTQVSLWWRTTQYIFMVTISMLLARYR